MRTQNVLLLGIVVVGGIVILGRRGEDRDIPVIGGAQLPQMQLPKMKYAPVFEAPVFEAPAFEAPAFEAPAFEAPAFQAPVFHAPTFAAFQPKTPRTQGRRKRLAPGTGVGGVGGGGGAGGGVGDKPFAI